MTKKILLVSSLLLIAATQSSPSSETRHVTAKMSHYWPPLGPPNCAEFVDGKCISRLANGDKWEKWVDRGAACPQELPMGTSVTLPDGSVYYCKDRGGKVVITENNKYWIDLLTEYTEYYYGQEIPIVIMTP